MKMGKKKSNFSPLIAKPENVLRLNPPRFKKFKRSPGGVQERKFDFLTIKSIFFSIFGRNGQKIDFRPISPQNPVRT